jgi:phenylacetate-CoA oxygenase PaaH subunit
MIYEIFRQERKGQPFQHAGTVTAPDERFAEIYAREQYGRRQESVALWLVPREAVSEIDEFPDEFEMKYRRVDGYSIKARLREAREKAGTLEMAPGDDSAVGARLASPSSTGGARGRGEPRPYEPREEV